MMVSDFCADVDIKINADNMMEALEKFTVNNVFKSIDSVSLIVNPNYTPEFDYESK